MRIPDSEGIAFAVEKMLKNCDVVYVHDTAGKVIGAVVKTKMLDGKVPELHEHVQGGDKDVPW